LLLLVSWVPAGQQQQLAVSKQGQRCITNSNSSTEV
jgi:hypothetical protein